jgi:adhesin transport system outer membrane protein
MFVIGRLKWCIFSTFVLVLQIAFLPVADPASALMGNSSATSLKVAQNSDREMLSPGESVSFDLTVVNTSRVAAASNVRIMNMLPAGFRYKSGSVKLNGASFTEPVISDDGKSLIFKVGNLSQDGSATIRFATEVSKTSKPGKAINYVSAISSGGGNSNVAMSTVLVREAVRTKEELNTAPVIAAETNTIPVPPKERLRPVTESGVTLFKADTGILPVPKEELPKAPEVIAEISEPTPPAETSSPAPGKTSGSPSLKTGTNVIAAQSIAPDVLVVPPPTTLSKQLEPPAAPDKTEKPIEDSLANSLVAPELQTLSKLTGKSEIPVLSDADGQFVKSMTENQIFGNEFAGQAGETSILESIRAGRGFNRESRAASARTEQAKAQTGQAVALLLPSVSVRGSYGSETSNPSVKIDPGTGKSVGSDTHPRTDASITVRQPLFDLPSFLDWRRRKVVEQVRGESYRVSDGDAYLTTANAYLSLVSSRLQVDMTREFEAQLTELLIYVEKRAKAGAASVSDMARVRARSQATLSSRLEQESAHAAAGIEFVRLTNLVSRKVRLPEPEDLGASILPKSFDKAVATAMRSNPEIAALKAEIQAAEIDMSSAKGRYLPKVDAEYTDSLSLHAGGDQSSAGQRDQRVMMVLNWNIFSGGSDYYNHAERAARNKELQYRLDDQRRRVVQTLSANYATLETTRERIASGYQELKSISTAADAMSKRMLSGNQSLLDLLDVYDRFYQIRSRLVSLHILEMSSVAQLVRLTHGAPGSDPIVK